MENNLKKILIVEDDKDFRSILEQSFSNQNDIQVIAAENGEQGVALAEKEHPDLIIMDILMPEMDGVAAARHIKEKGIDAHIIFLTNLGDEKNISKAMEAVNNMEYILKTDMRVADIIRRVREKLGLS